MAEKNAINTLNREQVFKETPEPWEEMGKGRIEHSLKEMRTFVKISPLRQSLSKTES
jgi:hypothetical protein